MRANLESGTTLTGGQFRSDNKFLNTTETLTGTWTIAPDSPQLLHLDPGGADRNVLLPAEEDGLFFVIVNSQADNETLTVYEDSTTTVIGVIESNGVGLFVCDGTTWRMVGTPATNHIVAIADAATYTVLAEDSGKTHVLPDLTADISISLPTAAVGLMYRFIYGGVAADAQDWAIDTGADANYYLGGVVHLDTDAGSGGDEVVPVFPDGDSNSILNVLVPQGGTTIEVWCDGTNWYVNGQVVGATAPTFADQA